MPDYTISLTDEQDALLAGSAQERGISATDLLMKIAGDHLRNLYREAATGAALARVEADADAVAAGITVTEGG